MFKNLSTDAIGIQCSLVEAVEIAKTAGFEGIDISIEEVADLADEKSIDYVLEIFKTAGIRMGGWMLPATWLGDESSHDEGLQKLPRLARVAQSIGCLRIIAWVWPLSDERPYKENFDWQVARFRPIAEILKEYDCRLSLEFIGPATLRKDHKKDHKYEFIYTIDGVLELCVAIGTGNVGLLLDCYHWYTSHGTLDDLEKLTSDQVVYVHINDAPSGIKVDEQMDRVRCLPGETGVIDISSFMRILRKTGYDGPVAVEPFNETITKMDPLDAARATYEALSGVWGS